MENKCIFHKYLDKQYFDDINQIYIFMNKIMKNNK